MDGRVKRKTFAELMAEAALQGMPEDKTTADLLNVPLSRGAILPLTEYLDRAEFDLSSGLPGAFADAVTAPARAARGEISDAEQIPEAFNFAGSLTLGSLLAPRPTGSVGVGGRAAKTLEAQQPQGIRAFHGSPHDFERFDMSKIGTGEGAQAYGHGLYFAEAEDVARSYRDSISAWKGDFGPRGIAARTLDNLGGDVDKAILELQGRKTGNPPFDASMDEAINYLKSGGSQGHMYEVNIRADPQDFLDYDAGISRQPEKVRQALSKIADDAGIPRGGFGDEIRSGDLDTLRTYVEQSLPRGEFEKRLKDLGIPGIRYLDQMSRGAGDGSSNYVVFDDAIIDIVKKYGIAGLALLQAAGYGTNEGEETQ